MDGVLNCIIRIIDSAVITITINWAWYHWNSASIEYDILSGAQYDASGGDLELAKGAIADAKKLKMVNPRRKIPLNLLKAVVAHVVVLPVAIAVVVAVAVSAAAVVAALRVVVAVIRSHLRKDLVKVLVVAPLRLMRGPLLAPAVNGQCHGVTRYGNSG